MIELIYQSILSILLLSIRYTFLIFHTNLLMAGVGELIRRYVLKMKKFVFDSNEYSNFLNLGIGG